MREALPRLEHVLLVRRRAPAPRAPGLASFASAMLAARRPTSRSRPTDPEDPALLHFTSGTTGTPKGALHVHQAVVAHHATGTLRARLPRRATSSGARPIPGWVTGTSYGILAPLMHGIRSVVLEDEFDAPRWYETLRARARQRLVHGAHRDPHADARGHRRRAAQVDFPDLRFVASVGEPLDPEAVVWGVEALGLPIHDNWWQTETGGIMIANYAACEIRPGSMGRPLPGVEAAIVRRRDDGGVEPVDAPDVEGELALRAGWPSMFRAYLGDDERYRKCFRDGWYLSGDLARRDADGYFWFVGRADDVIKTAGPPDRAVRGRERAARAPGRGGRRGDRHARPGGGRGGEGLRRAAARATSRRRRCAATCSRTRAARLGPAIAPRAIEFRDALPHTRSGKIMRRLLRARELGLPEGDLSTLEEGA